jgi:hypothetical protein
VTNNKKQKIDFYIKKEISGCRALCLIRWLSLDLLSCLISSFVHFVPCQKFGQIRFQICNQYSNFTDLFCF